MTEDYRGWLFKKDSKGRIRRWKGSVWTDDAGKPFYMSESGLNKGATKTSQNMCVASKTMSGVEVAHSKVDSQYAKKRKDGYFETEEEARAYEPTKCMLLHKYPENMDKIVFPAFILPKLDGVCAVYMDMGSDAHMKSREDNIFHKMKPMAEGLRDRITMVAGSAAIGRVHMHGEIYAHGHKVSEIIEAMKGDNKELLDKLKFFCFDYMPVKSYKGMHYKDRLQHGMKTLDWSRGADDHFVPIKILIARNREEVDVIHDSFLKQGFEGSVICNMDGKYVYDTRSYDKLKLKNLITEEFKITGVESEKLGEDDMVVFVCVTKAGAEFKVRPAWSHKKRMAEWARKDTYAGKLLTVEYRSLTKYNVPFHPVGQAVRDYE